MSSCVLFYWGYVYLKGEEEGMYRVLINIVPSIYICISKGFIVFFCRNEI